MLRRSFRSLSAVALVASALFATGGIAEAAGKKDQAAMKLHDQAMDEHYLSVEFDKAESALQSALQTCGKSGCSAQVLGKIHVALGTVHGVGQGNIETAGEDFVAALSADPKAKLIEGLITPELEAAFEEAKGQAGPAPAGDDDDDDDDDGPVAGGDFDHTPPEEQAIHTPVPIFAEVPAEIGATQVVVLYKPFGGTKWQKLQLTALAEGFGGEIPCKDVTTTGEIRYYIIATDDDDTPLATAGSRKAPFTVPIKNKIEGNPPSLPAQAAPAACMAKEDCPPGLPGCPGAGGRGDKGWGATCEESQECKEGLVCLNGLCEEGEEGADSGGGKNDGVNLLIPLNLQFDLALISSADNVCSKENSENYACFLTGKDEQFYGNPVDQEGSNGVSGGLGLGSVRVLVGFDGIVKDWGLEGGGRLGFAFGGSPSSSNEPTDDATNPPNKAKSFNAFHLEARLAYNFNRLWGARGIPKGEIAPYFFVGGGLAQVNASVPVNVCDADPPETGRNACPPNSSFREVDAYQITGLNFIGFGPGARYFFTENIGAQAELKFMIMLPTSGFVIAPSVGPVVGF